MVAATRPATERRRRRRGRDRVATEPMTTMKEVRLAYGRDGLVARVPDDAVVVTATELPGLPDEAGAVLDVAARAGGGAAARRRRRPRRGRARAAAGRGGRGPRWRWSSPTSPGPCPTARCCPRCWPSSSGSVPAPSGSTLLCATGTHRAATPEEMVELVGPDVVARYRIHQHQAEAGGRARRGGRRSTARPSGSTAATSRPTSAS